MTKTDEKLMSILINTIDYDERYGMHGLDDAITAIKEFMVEKDDPPMMLYKNGKISMAFKKPSVEQMAQWVYEHLNTNGYDLLPTPKRFDLAKFLVEKMGGVK